MPRPKALIVDLDGTLALNNSGRPWFGEGYEARLHEDEVNQSVLMVLDALYDDRRIDHVLFVSGRTESGRAETEKWLTKLDWRPGSHAASLFMRAVGDFRPDHEIKRAIYDDHIQEAYDILLALDDRPSIVALWRSLDIPTWQVAEYR